MTNAIRARALGLGAAGLASLLLGSLASGQTPSLEELASATLGITGGAVGEYQILESFDGHLLIGFEHPDQPLFLELSPHSVRAEGFEVRHQLEDGSWTAVESEPVRTFRGVVLGEPGSAVAASVLEDGLHARILLSGGREFWIEPLWPRVEQAQLQHHVLYQTEQVLDSGRTCDADLVNGLSTPRIVPGGEARGDADSSGLGGSMALAASTTAELACDADFEYFSRWGSGTQSRIESVVNTMNIQYERDVDISHAITAILIRTSSNDPYTKKPADQLLFQFRAEWNANQSGVQRDVAHLFTGRALAGSTIGIAWVGQVCNLDLAYSLVESDFNGNFASATDLSAHELGHNWGASHCSCTSYTMNSFITTANIFNPVGTIPTITAYRNSQSCFGPVDPPQDSTSIHVGSIVPGTQNAGQGNKRGTATVTIVTDTGSAEAGASVSGTFSGDYNESVAGVTDGSGNVTFVTSTTQKGGVNFTFCVDSVSGSLPYAAGDNAETCDSF